MKAHLRCLTICSILLLSFGFESFSQNRERSYNLDFVKGQYIDSTNPKEILLMLKHSTKSNRDEKLIISGKLTYSLGNGAEKTEILGRSDNRHSIEIFGKDIELKEPYLFKLIKDSVDFTNKNDFKLIVFHLRNLSDKYVDKMTFTYGLWEPTNQDVRIETKYEIKIDR
jgi:hypothetical protein